MPPGARTEARGAFYALRADQKAERREALDRCPSGCRARRCAAGSLGRELGRPEAVGLPEPPRPQTHQRACYAPVGHMLYFGNRLVLGEPKRGRRPAGTARRETS